MTHSQRILLADRYLALLDEGKIDALAPILTAAETDAELSDMIISLSRGYSEEHGRDVSPEVQARVRARLDEIMRAEAEGDLPSASAKTSPAGGKTFLVVTRDLSGKSMKQAAEDLGGTTHFFEDLNRYPNHADPRVQALHGLVYELNAERNGVPVDVSADAMEHNNPLYGLAAYAEGDIDHEEPSFEEILAYSGMTPEQQAFWRDEAEHRAGLQGPHNA